ncbi:MAG: class I SAM-dependent methyltransferase [Chloroflexi bacterium]|nr:class I SAM-dependent methyltransferase [Chloroflexota bacterium]
MKDNYSVFSKHYNEINSSVSEAVRMQTLEFARRSGVKSVCDFGCGTGELIKLFYNNKMDAYGCDISVSMVREAERELACCNGVEIKHADMVEYNPPVHVDLATSFFDSINYLLSEEAWVRFFNNVFQILNKGGYFIFDFVTVYDLKECWPGYHSNLQGQDWVLQRLSEFDLQKQIGIELMQWSLFRENHWQTYTEIHEHFALTKERVHRLLTDIGFIDIKMTDSDTGNDVYDNETTRIMVHAKKNKGTKWKAG